MARLVEECIEVVDLALVVECRELRRARLAADRVDDLVLENARKPGLDGRLAGKVCGALQRCYERVLHDIFRYLVIAKLQACNAQEISAVRVELGGYVGVRHGAWHVQRNHTDEGRRM